MENIAIHSASSFGGAQFYISCGQINVENGGNGTPGPLVAFPGAYTGYVSFSVSRLRPMLTEVILGAWNSDQYQCESCALGI